MANKNHLGYGSGPFTPEELETIRAEIERNRKYLDDLDGVAIPAVTADYQRHLAELGEPPLEVAAEEIVGATLGEQPAAGDALEGPPWMVAAVRAAEEEARSEPLRSAMNDLVVRLFGTDRILQVELPSLAGTAEPIFPSDIEIPAGWLGAHPVSIHFTRNVAGTWCVNRTGTSLTLLLRFLALDGAAIAEALEVGAVRVALPIQSPSLIGSLEVQAISKAGNTREQ